MKKGKKLGFLDVFSISSGAMISSGIFILPAVAYAYAGPALPLAYLIGGLAAFIGILSVTELSTAMPKAGGDYFFINRALGPLMGTVTGFLSWFALSLKTAFAIFGLAEILYLFTGFNITLLALAATAFFVLVNLAGAKEAAVFEVILVVGLILIMVFFIASGIPHLRTERFNGFLREGLGGIVSTAAVIFVSFGGLLKVASISEEISNPKRTIPLAMMTSLAVVTVLYTAMTAVLVGILDGEEILGSLTPIAEAASKSVGPLGYWLITAASALAFISTANAGMLAASRYPLALSKDRLLPPVFAAATKRKQVPVTAIIVTGIIISVSLQFELETLAKSASAVIITAYILSSVSVIILRESRLKHYRPSFSVPLYPFIPILSILIFGFFLYDLGIKAVEYSMVFVLASLLLYLFYGRRRSSSESALLYLMKRVIDKKLDRRLLESELRDIIRFRDDVEDDPVDRIIKDSAVLEIGEHMFLDNFFHAVSERAAEAMDLSKEEFYRLLCDREQQASTAISEFVAIPHIVIEKDDYFHLLLVRTPRGVEFSDASKNVRAVFLCIGSRNLRDLHLKVLSAIAKTVQREGFEEKWLQHGDVRFLRDIVLEEKAAEEG